MNGSKSADMQAVYIGQVSGSHFLLFGPSLCPNHKQSMLELGWLSRWFNSQQLGSRSRFDGGLYHRDDPFHRPDHLNKSLLDTPAAEPPSFLLP